MTAVYTPTALLTERLWPALLRFGARVLEYAILAEADARVELASRRRRAHGARRASVAGALGGLSDVLRGSRDAVRAPGEDQTPLQVAVRLVARSCGVSANVGGRAAEPTLPAGASESAAVVERLARRNGMRMRRIMLAPGWWKRDGPSFVGFAAADDRPLGVVSDRRGGYRAVDPASATRGRS